MNAAPHRCTPMGRALDDPAVPCGYDPEFREYWFDWLDGASLLTYPVCPFCGVVLPESLRSEWFERVWAMGLEQEDPGVPADMRSDAWWRNTPLDDWVAAQGSSLATGELRHVAPVRRDTSDPILPHGCQRMVHACGEPDLPISYTTQIGAYAIEIQDTGERGIVIEFCPFCGAHLPS